MSNSWDTGPVNACDNCGDDLDGTAVTKIVDGSYSSDGEFEHANTETYHVDCVTVSNK